MKKSQRILIAFIPDKKIVSNIEKIRKIADIKTYANPGLRTPHITIIDNSYSDLERVDKELKKIAKTIKPFTAKIKGIDTFVVKKDLKIKRYEENNSLIYFIKKNVQMNKFRKELYKKLNFLKSGERLEQWKGENPNMPKKALASVRKYGTPFGMVGWMFHTTIGLIPKLKQKEILKKIKKLDLSEDFEIDCFGLFVRKDGWELFKKYELRRKV